MKTKEYKPARCEKVVRVAGLAFPHYHQCSRKATHVNGDGKRVCAQHSDEAVARRKAEGEAADKRRRDFYYAVMAAKNKSR